MRAQGRDMAPIPGTKRRRNLEEYIAASKQPWRNWALRGDRYVRRPLRRHDAGERVTSARKRLAVRRHSAGPRRVAAPHPHAEIARPSRTCSVSVTSREVVHSDESASLAHVMGDRVVSGGRMVEESGEERAPVAIWPECSQPCVVNVRNLQTFWRVPSSSGTIPSGSSQRQVRPSGPAISMTFNSAKRPGRRGSAVRPRRRRRVTGRASAASRARIWLSRCPCTAPSAPGPCRSSERARSGAR